MKNILILLFVVPVVFFSFNIPLAKAEYFDLDLDSYSEEELIDLVETLQEQVDEASGKSSGSKSYKYSNDDSDEMEELDEYTGDLEYLNELSEEELAEQLVLIEIQSQIQEIAKLIEELIKDLEK